MMVARPVLEKSFWITIQQVYNLIRTLTLHFPRQASRRFIHMRFTPASLKVFLKITSVVFIFAHFTSAQAQNRPDIVWQRMHSGEVNSVAFSPDAQILATASEDKTVKLWRVSDGTLLKTLGPHFQYVESVVISPDNQIVASAGGDYLIRMWRISDGTLIRTIDSGTYPLVFSPDGQWLIGGVRIYRVSDGEWWGYHRAFPRGLSFSPDGQVIAGGEHYGGQVALGRGSDWSDLQLIEPHTEGVNSTAFSPDGQVLASAGYDRTIRFSRMPGGALLRTITADVFYLL
jgi:WD40 repeat protein